MSSKGGILRKSPLGSAVVLQIRELEEIEEPGMATRPTLWKGDCCAQTRASFRTEWSIDRSNIATM
jgi:hypothetical protein